MPKVNGFTGIRDAENAMEGEKMERIGNYNAYSRSVYEQNRTVRDSGASGTAAAREANTASKASSKVTLSDDAKNLLKELKKTYGNMDFIIADYETDEEAASYLARGTGEYSVLLTPEELEKMAADEEYKTQNLQTLDDALTKLGEMKNQLGESGQDVKRLGVAIGNDGEISYFAELEKTNEKQRERIEKQREGRREEAAEAKEKAEKEEAEEPVGAAGRAFRQEGVKHTTVFASSVEELAEKIGQVDWDAVREDRWSPAGSHFDFTV